MKQTSRAIAEIRRICDEAEDHETAFPIFRKLIEERLAREAARIEAGPIEKSEVKGRVGIPWNASEEQKAKFIDLIEKSKKKLPRPTRH